MGTGDGNGKEQPTKSTNIDTPRTMIIWQYQYQPPVNNLISLQELVDLALKSRSLITEKKSNGSANKYRAFITSVIHCLLRLKRYT